MGTWQQQASNLDLNLLLASTTRLHRTSPAQTQTHKKRRQRKKRVQIVRFTRTDLIATASYRLRRRVLSGDERPSRTSERSQVASAFKIFKWPAQLLHKKKKRFRGFTTRRLLFSLPLPRIISSWRTSPFRRRSARTGSEQWRRRCGCDRKAKARAEVFFESTRVWIGIWWERWGQSVSRSFESECSHCVFLRWVLHITLAYCILHWLGVNASCRTFWWRLWLCNTVRSRCCSEWDFSYFILSFLNDCN